jgi:ribosome-binding protein aMBF1 (putative translation factor)
MAEGESSDGGHERPLSFGDRMRQRRLDRGWSQMELAKRAEIDPGWISRLESGERQNISLVAARRIARALQVSLDYLADTFGESDEAPAGMGMIGVVAVPAGLMHQEMAPRSL